MGSWRDWVRNQIKGIEQGVELGQVLLYKTMIKNGMSVNEISKVCSISVESLKQVLNNWQEEKNLFFSYVHNVKEMNILVFYTGKGQWFWTSEKQCIKSGQDIDGCRMAGFRRIRGKGGD